MRRLFWFCFSGSGARPGLGLVPPAARAALRAGAEAPGEQGRGCGMGRDGACLKTLCKLAFPLRGRRASAWRGGGRGAWARGCVGTRLSLQGQVGIAKQLAVNVVLVRLQVLCLVPAGCVPADPGPHLPEPVPRLEANAAPGALHVPCFEGGRKAEGPAGTCSGAAASAPPKRGASVTFASGVPLQTGPYGCRRPQAALPASDERDRNAPHPVPRGSPKA